MITLPFPPSDLSGKKRRPFSAEDNARLEADYRAYVESGRLDVLAAEMGRSKSVLCAKAKELGLTDPNRARAAAAKIVGDSRRGKPLAWDHPRGMTGKRHTEETKQSLRLSSLEYRASLSKDAASAIATKAMRTTVERHGRIAPQVSRGNWKAGWREIGGKRNYYRSRWEANYARYLQWLKEQRQIADWEHEPETFWFEAIRRGVRSYLPDFRVTENDQSSALHEVKGWMDARSKTTIRRMAKYHPQEKLIVVREREYKAISIKVAAIIPGWEQSGRGDRW